MTIPDLCATFVNGRVITPKRGDAPGTPVINAPSFVHENLSLQGLTGKILAVDMMHWLFRMNYGAHKRQAGSIKSHTDEIDNAKIMQSLIRDAIGTCLSAAKVGVLLVFVVDGDEKQGKEDTHNERKKQNDNLKKKMEEYALLMESLSYLSPEYQAALKEYKKYKVSSSKPEYSNALRVVEVLKSIGVPTIQARGDAERACCMMVNCGMVEGVVSADSDCLAHGAALWIRDLNHQTFNAVFRDEVLAWWGLTINQFQDICTMLGTDYNKRIPGVGPEKIIKLIRQYGTMEAAWTDLSGEAQRAATNEAKKSGLNPTQCYNKIIEEFNPVATRSMLQQTHPSDACKYPLTAEHFKFKQPTINMMTYLNFYGVGDLLGSVSQISSLYGTQQFYYSECRQPHPGIPPFDTATLQTTRYGTIPPPTYVHTSRDKIEDDKEIRDLQQEPLAITDDLDLSDLTLANAFGM